MAQHHNEQDSGRNIRVAFFLNIVFTVIEIAGGLWTNSVAILSDALHDLGDTFSLSIAWLFDRYSRRKGDARFSFGYQRFSLLGAVVNIMVLVAGSAFILSRAIPRILHPEPSNASGMLVFAGVGIVVNGIAAWRVSRGRTMNERVVTWHLLEDVLGWAAVLVVGVVLLFWEVQVLDPLLSVAITGYVLVNIVRNGRRTLTVFLQGVPEEVDVVGLAEKAKALPGVLSMHHIHAWSLDGEHHVLTAHIVVRDSVDRDEIIEVKCAVKRLLQGLNFAHTTIEVEFETESCSLWENA